MNRAALFMIKALKFLSRLFHRQIDCIITSSLFHFSPPADIAHAKALKRKFLAVKKVNKFRCLLHLQEATRALFAFEGRKMENEESQHRRDSRRRKEKERQICILLIARRSTLERARFTVVKRKIYGVPSALLMII